MRRLVLVLALILVSCMAKAETRGVVTVFPLNFSAAQMDRGSRAAVDEGVRSIIAQILEPAGYVVLSNETRLQILKDNGIDPSRVCDASCVLEAARELKATYFVSGVISSTDGILIGFMRLFRVEDGKQIGGATISGRSALGLLSSLRTSVDTFLSLLAASPDRSARGASASASVDAEWIGRGVKAQANMNAMHDRGGSLKNGSQEMILMGYEYCLERAFEMHVDKASANIVHHAGSGVYHLTLKSMGGELFDIRYIYQDDVVVSMFMDFMPKSWAMMMMKDAPGVIVIGERDWPAGSGKQPKYVFHVTDPFAASVIEVDR